MALVVAVLSTDAAGGLDLLNPDELLECGNKVFAFLKFTECAISIPWLTSATAEKQRFSIMDPRDTAILARMTAVASL